MSNNEPSTLNMPKSISYLSSELKSSTQELIRLRGIILSLKSYYKVSILEYNSILSSILDQEVQIEELNSKLAKLKQKTTLTLYQLSSPSYFLKLKDSAKNPDCSKQMNLLFAFCSPTESNINFDYSSYLLLIAKASDFIELLEYSFVNQNDLYQTSRFAFNRIKNVILNEKKTIQYPFDIIFEYINHLYLIIAYEEEKEHLMKKHNEETNKKNTIFVEIKRLEREVNSNDCIYRRIDKNVNEINTLLNNYKSLNSNNKKSAKSKLYKEFVQSLKDFHPMIDRTNVNKNYVSTLSINSEVNTGNGNANAKVNGDYHNEQKVKGKKARNSKQNSIHSNFSFVTTSNKNFISSFADILPDQPETELNNIISLLKKKNTLNDEKTRITNQCSTIESQREAFYEEDFTDKVIEYSFVENKQSICEELPISLTQKFSIRTTTIGNNNNLITNKESMKFNQSISRYKAILYVY